jgi:hypothetical protein
VAVGQQADSADPRMLRRVEAASDYRFPRAEAAWSVAHVHYYQSAPPRRPKRHKTAVIEQRGGAYRHSVLGMDRFRINERAL